LHPNNNLCYKFSFAGASKLKVERVQSSIIKCRTLFKKKQPNAISPWLLHQMRTRLDSRAARNNN
jgi:hypothetical protein